MVLPALKAAGLCRRKKVGFNGLSSSGDSNGAILEFLNLLHLNSIPENSIYHVFTQLTY